MPFKTKEARAQWRAARKAKLAAQTTGAVTPTTETNPTPAAPCPCSGGCHGRTVEARPVTGADLRALRHRLRFPTRWAFAAWLALPDATVAACEANADGPVPEHVAARVAPWMP